MQKIGKYDLKTFSGQDKFRRLDINDNTAVMSDYMDSNDVAKAETDLCNENRFLQSRESLQRSMSGVANLHVWKAKSAQENAVMDYGEAEFVTLLESDTASSEGEERPLPGKAKVWYADNAYDNSGVAALADPVSSLEVDYQNPNAAAEVLRNRFFTVDGSSQVYFGVMRETTASVRTVQNAATFTHTWVVRYGAQPVTPGKKSVAKDEYVVSESPDAYGSDQFEYAGQLGGWSSAMPYYGTYTGNGEYMTNDGQILGNDINLGFRPKLVILGKGWLSQSYMHCGFYVAMEPMMADAESVFRFTDNGFKVARTNKDYYAQINTNGEVYPFVAFK